MEANLFFDRCYLVNLERRGDRLAEFQSRIVAQPWPFPAPERWIAVDGKLCPFPPWFKQGKGAWGCYRSHCQIIERCLNENVQSVLILEDDAVLCEDFATKATEFLSSVPADWDQIYLGGQILSREEHPPQRINDQVLRPFNVNRTHAYALSRNGMEIVYRHLHKRNWAPKHHIDHHLGRLHAEAKINVYCPVKFLVGQAPGETNIGDNANPDHTCGHWWNGEKMIEGNIPAVLAVVGPQRSGTSCTAGILHKLGVSMGRQFPPPNKHNAKGFYEAVHLRRLCWKCYKEPWMKEKNTYAERVKILREWAAGRKDDGPLIGAKHPTLCMLVPEMLEAWPKLKIITTDRPVEDILASLRKAHWMRNVKDAGIRNVTTTMIEKRDADLERLKIPALHIPFAELLRDPTAAIDYMIEFAGISPTDEQRAEAIAHVDPKLNHHTAVSSKRGSKAA